MTVHEKRVVRACDDIRRLNLGLNLDALEEALLNSDSGLASMDIQDLANRMIQLKTFASKNWLARLMGW